MKIMGATSPCPSAAVVLIVAVFVSSKPAFAAPVASLHQQLLSADGIIPEADFTETASPKISIACPILRALYRSGYLHTADPATGRVPYSDILSVFKAKLGFSGSVLAMFKSMASSKQDGGLTVDNSLELFNLPREVCCASTGLPLAKKMQLMSDFTTDVDEVASDFSTKEWGNLVEHMASIQQLKSHAPNAWPLLVFQYSLVMAVFQESHRDPDSAPSLALINVQDIFQDGEIPIDFKPADTGKWLINGEKLQEIVCKEDIVIPNTSNEHIRSQIDALGVSFPRDMICGSDWSNCVGDSGRCPGPGQVVHEPEEPDNQSNDPSGYGSSEDNWPTSGSAAGSAHFDIPSNPNATTKEKVAEAVSRAMGEPSSEDIARVAEAQAQAHEVQAEAEAKAGGQSTHRK